MTALSLKTALGLAIAAAATGGGAATPDKPSHPADANARVAPQRYQPALQHYQTLQDPAPPVADWPAANRRVHEAGGWRAYLREAQSGVAPATTPAPGASSPARSAGGHQH